jgi:Putative Actinobacterial Holin-X, holin superfamily III
MATHRNDPESLRQQPTGELVKQLAEDVSTLVRQELELARAEMMAKARHAGIGLGEMGTGGIAGLFALGALTTCAIAAMGLVMPVWAAALIVAAVYGAVAAVLIVIGRRQLDEASPPVPERTRQTIEENIEWVKNRKPSSGR